MEVAVLRSEPGIGRASGGLRQVVRGRLNGLHGGKDAGGVELNEHFGHLVDGRGEANAILIAVMHCIVELHEDIAEDMHLLKALLVDAQRLDNVTTSSSIRVQLVNFAGDPVMGGHVIFYSIDDIGQIWESELVALFARNDIAVRSLELIIMGLRERGERGS